MLSPDSLTGTSVMKGLRTAIAEGDAAGFIREYALAIEQRDVGTVRTGLRTLRSLPRPAAAEVFEKLRGVWPELVRADVAALGSERGSGDELPPSNVLQSLLRKVLDGDRAGAMALVERKASKWQAQYGDVANIRALVELMPTRDRLPRSLVQDRGEDVVVSPRGERGTVVVFCGLSDQPTFDVPILDAMLAQHEYRGVYLRDPGRTAFVAGVGEGGRAAFAATLARLLGDESGDVVFAGSSIGGYAAIDWGCELDVGRMVAFSAPTSSRPEFMAKIGEERCGLFQKVLAARGIELDLPARLGASDPVGRIDLHFGDGMKTDRAHAEELRHPAVARRPVEGFSLHHSMLPVVWTGRLGQALGLGAPVAGPGDRADAPGVSLRSAPAPG